MMNHNNNDYMKTLTLKPFLEFTDYSPDILLEINNIENFCFYNFSNKQKENYTILAEKWKKVRDISELEGCFHKRPEQLYEINKSISTKSLLKMLEYSKDPYYITLHRIQKYNIEISDEFKIEFINNILKYSDEFSNEYSNKNLNKHVFAIGLLFKLDLDKISDSINLDNLLSLHKKLFDIVNNQLLAISNNKYFEEIDDVIYFKTDYEKLQRFIKSCKNSNKASELKRYYKY